MELNKIIKYSKSFENSYSIEIIDGKIKIGVYKNNKWKLLIIGIISLIIPTLLNNFIPITNESDISFFNKVNLICYTLPILLMVVYFLQQKQKTTISKNTKEITFKNKIVKLNEITDFEIEHFKKRQLNSYSIYLKTKTQLKILIGATTSNNEKTNMENYAKSIIEYIRNEQK